MGTRRNLLVQPPLSKNIHFSEILHLLCSCSLQQQGWTQATQIFSSAVQHQLRPTWSCLICEQTLFICEQPALSQLPAAGMQPRLFPGRSCHTQPCNSPAASLLLAWLFYWSALQNLGSLFHLFFLLNTTWFSINWIYRWFIDIYTDILRDTDFPLCLCNSDSPMPKH